MTTSQATDRQPDESRGSGSCCCCQTRQHAERAGASAGDATRPAPQRPIKELEAGRAQGGRCGCGHGRDASEPQSGLHGHGA